MADTLELYDGGMLDLSFLGAAEVDCHGNVNVSKFGSRCTGPGGFVNISQNTKRVFFTGTFTAGGLKEEVRDDRLVILQEGRSKKFRRQVEQITFSGDYAVKSGQDVTFLTERAVLKLTPDGLMLTEIAPGAVSYTHLDVYKRQPSRSVMGPCFLTTFSILKSLNLDISGRVSRRTATHSRTNRIRPVGTPKAR